MIPGAMDDSASSKVTVEYHDPSGVFPLISRDLAARLPLRNLNWKSPIRPLRSIGALHVEFVPDAVSEANPSSPVDRRLQRVDSYGPRPTSTPPAGGDTAARERRHQIPGLQQTPYLKLYILRCDDKDTYKAASRQLLRDWVRKNAPETQSNPAVNKLDHHDAFEWLILHVVIPDTVAASEPRWTAASRKDPDELVERPQSITKWPGKSTRTVLDKIRADFNPTSKSAPERVAQLRLQKNAVPPQLLPKTPVASPYSESPQEQENAWQDLISKFKTLILMSFDLRVSQYEDDIREKDLQRTLPGWNFCTFFVLKEGLAKGFESVGLVEDALAIYDELSVGLDAAMRDYTPGNTLADNVSMVRKEIDRLFQGRLDDGTIEQMAQTLREFLDKPLDLRQQEYREAIVSSQISLFDFQCYIFARQKALLLRLGNVDKLRSGLNDVTKQTLQVQPTRQSAGSHVDDELAYIAGACNRASVFATANARILKNELTAGYEKPAVYHPVDTFVDSFVGLLMNSPLNSPTSVTQSHLHGALLLPSKCLMRRHHPVCPLFPDQLISLRITGKPVSELLPEEKLAASTSVRVQINIQLVPALCGTPWRASPNRRSPRQQERADQASRNLRPVALSCTWCRGGSSRQWRRRRAGWPVGLQSPMRELCRTLICAVTKRPEKKLSRTIPTSGNRIRCRSTF